MCWSVYSISGLSSTAAQLDRDLCTNTGRLAPTPTVLIDLAELCVLQAQRRESVDKEDIYTTIEEVSGTFYHYPMRDHTGFFSLTETVF